MQRLTWRLAVGQEMETEDKVRLLGIYAATNKEKFDDKRVIWKKVSAPAGMGAPLVRTGLTGWRVEGGGCRWQN